MRVVGKVGEACVVEYERDGICCRCILPKTVVRQYGNHIPSNVLARGIEVGVEVEEAFQEIAFPSNNKILNYVREHGFWTSEDVLRNTDRFKQKVAESFGDQIAQMLVRMRKNAKSSG
jgi:hypothetical protein